LEQDCPRFCVGRAELCYAKSDREKRKSLFYRLFS
jgi:hypothetical protein